MSAFEGIIYYKLHSLSTIKYTFIFVEFGVLPEIGQAINDLDWMYVSNAMFHNIYFQLNISI